MYFSRTYSFASPVTRVGGGQDGKDGDEDGQAKGGVTVLSGRLNLTCYSMVVSIWVLS